MEQRDEMAGQIAQSVMDDLRTLVERAGGDRKFRPRVWVAADHARVYTGSRNEHLRVYRDGRIERSQPCMSWGHLIDQLQESDAAGERA